MKGSEGKHHRSERAVLVSIGIIKDLMWLLVHAKLDLASLSTRASEGVRRTRSRNKWTDSDGRMTTPKVAAT